MRFVFRRLSEAFQEVGVLLIAFAPLDAILNSRSSPGTKTFLGLTSAAVYFFLIGVALFWIGLYGEWRYKRE